MYSGETGRAAQAGAGPKAGGGAGRGCPWRWRFIDKSGRQGGSRDASHHAAARWCHRWLAAGGVLLLAGCATGTGAVVNRPDVPPLSAASVQKAEAAPDVREAAALGGAFSNYQMVGDLLQRAADAGNPAAQVALGDRHRQHGKAGKDEPAIAATLYRRAAEQGYAPGEVALGKAYRLGQGLALDKAEAAYWYRQAARQHDPDGKLLYGIALLGGEGVTQDKQQAMLLIAADDVPDSPTASSSSATPVKPADKKNLVELNQEIARTNIKLHILARVDAGKDFSETEIDKIARQAAMQ